MAENAVATTMQAVSLVEPLLQSFRGLKLASSFEKDFDSSLIRLDLSCLRLLTWYESYSSGGSIEDERTVKSLQTINDTLDNAIEVYNTYVREKSENDVEAQWKRAPSVQQSTCEAALQLHIRIQARINSQNTSVKKTRIFSWLLFHREELDRIVTTIFFMINQHIEEFPPERRALFDDEREWLVDTAQNAKEIRLLKDACDGFDQQLHRAAHDKLAVMFDIEFDTIEVKNGRNNVYGFDISKERENLPEGQLPRQRFKEIKSTERNSVFGTRFS